MHAIIFDKHYDLCELNYYGLPNDKSARVVELTVEGSVEDFSEVQAETRTPVTIIGTETQFMLSGYTLSEWFEEDGNVKLVYVK